MKFEYTTSSMNIFISGIGGVGMGAIALLARDLGHSVRGSDASHSLTTNEVEHAGISISYTQTSENLKAVHAAQPIDWYLHTAALPADHLELQAAKKLGIRTSKRDEFIQEVIASKNLKLLAVAGTHGKTTTTAMLVWAFQELNIPVTYLLGSSVSWGASGRYEPGSDYFVYECDEFDRNFLQFQPELSIITSIEYDHPDTYQTEKAYASAFRQFIGQSKAAILWEADGKWIENKSSNTWVLKSSEVQQLRLTGEHNRRNGTLVAKALEKLDLGERVENTWAIESFPGVRRRFEKLADNLYSDYGHTPTEIAATLQLAREVSDHVVLIYQPHQNVRQHEIYKQYSDTVFKNAQTVYWLPTYLSREKQDLEILMPEELTKGLRNTDTHLAELGDELWQTIKDARASGALVLCMGAGSIDEWVRASI